MWGGGGGSVGGGAGRAPLARRGPGLPAGPTVVLPVLLRSTRADRRHGPYAAGLPAHQLLRPHRRAALPARGPLPARRRARARHPEVRRPWVTWRSAAPRRP